MRVFGFGEDVQKFEVDAGDGFASNDALAAQAGRSTTLLFDKNDEGQTQGGRHKSSLPSMARPSVRTVRWIPATAP